MSPKFSFKEVAPLFFAILIDILGFGLVYPVLTALFTTSQAILPPSTTETIRFWYLGIGFMLYPLFMFFGSSFLGDLSDRLGRKKVILICMAGLTIGFCLMGWGVTAASLTFLFIGRALSGLMGGSMPVVLAAISDLSPGANKAIHMSYVALIQSIGFVLGPLLGGILSDSQLISFFNFSLPFFFSAGMAAMAFIWISASFKETFSSAKHHFDWLRLFKNFYEAAKHKKIRLLSVVFFLMQIAIALYLQLILIYYRQTFGYQSATMGLFNAYVGLWFGLGLLLIVPYAAKHFPIEKVAYVCLLSAGLSEIVIPFMHNELLLWLIAIPLALSVQVGFTSMLTSFSNAATKSEQGWAMGITGAVIALSFTFTGLTPSLIPVLGIMPQIFAGGLFMLLASFLMYLYLKQLRNN